MCICARASYTHSEFMNNDLSAEHDSDYSEVDVYVELYIQYIAVGILCIMIRLCIFNLHFHLGGRFQCFSFHILHNNEPVYHCALYQTPRMNVLKHKNIRDFCSLNFKTPLL